MTEPTRLSKRLIQQIGCSRREAELYIEGGWVTVDGEVVDQPQFLVAQQTSSFIAQREYYSGRPGYLIDAVAADLNKEQTLAQLTADNRWTEDKSAGRLLKRHFMK